VKPEEVYILDSSALLVYADGMPGKEVVEEVLQKGSRGGGSVEIYMTVADWGRAYYSRARQKGEDAARELLQELEKLPLNIVVINRKVAMEAAAIMKDYPLDYADSFACAMASITDGKLVTANGALKAVEDILELVWL